MPDSNTFSCPPIGEFVEKYLRDSSVSVDPFARNKDWATYTNDVNPETSAQHHMDAVDYLEFLSSYGVKADLFIYDPPYSPRQISEHYKEFGRKATSVDTQLSPMLSKARGRAYGILKVGGIALSFGWNTVGFGKHFEFIEVLNVCHGGGHNDTICMAQRKICHQPELWAHQQCN